MFAQVVKIESVMSRFVQLCNEAKIIGDNQKLI